MESESAYPKYQNRYPSGQLQNEMTPGKAGKQVMREWHPNGILASEKHFLNMKEHGKSKRWSSEGKLLGINVFKNGTGIDREWYEDGKIESEVAFLNGEITGPMRLYHENGDLWQTRYLYRGAFISKR